MNKKLITIICLIVLTTSSFSMLVVNAAPGDIGFMKLELKDVNIIDDHDGALLGTGEIYFKFNMNGSELRTAKYEGIDNGDNVTLNFVLFESLVKEGSDFFLFIEVWEEDTADADDYVGEYNFTLLPIVFADIIAVWGYSDVIVVTGTDATFYLEITVDDAPTIPPEVDDTPYITVTMTSAIIHNKHEITGKGDGEIYFSYEVNGVKTSTTEYKDIEDGETIIANLDLYKGPLLDDEFQFMIACWEADIDYDDEPNYKPEADVKKFVKVFERYVSKYPCHWHLWDELHERKKSVPGTGIVFKGNTLREFTIKELFCAV